jgi:hypothetical protein
MVSSIPLAGEKGILRVAGYLQTLAQEPGFLGARLNYLVLVRHSLWNQGFAL